MKRKKVNSTPDSTNFTERGIATTNWERRQMMLTEINEALEEFSMSQQRFNDEPISANHCSLAALEEILDVFGYAKYFGIVPFSGAVDLIVSRNTKLGTVLNKFCCLLYAQSDKLFPTLNPRKTANLRFFLEHGMEIVDIILRAIALGNEERGTGQVVELYDFDLGVIP